MIPWFLAFVTCLTRGYLGKGPLSGFPASTIPKYRWCSLCILRSVRV
jgi:hypothetical protein